MTYHINLSTITLARGAHLDRESGMRLLEAVAHFASEPHSDRPACTSPILGSPDQALGDALPTAGRLEPDASDVTA